MVVSVGTQVVRAVQAALSRIASKSKKIEGKFTPDEHVPIGVLEQVLTLKQIDGFINQLKKAGGAHVQTWIKRLTRVRRRIVAETKKQRRATQPRTPAPRGVSPAPGRPRDTTGVSPGHPSKRPTTAEATMARATSQVERARTTGVSPAPGKPKVQQATSTGRGRQRPAVVEGKAEFEAAMNDFRKIITEGTGGKAWQSANKRVNDAVAVLNKLGYDPDLMGGGKVVLRTIKSPTGPAYSKGGVVSLSSFFKERN